MKEAMVFNGQGSEFAGMGKFFYRESLIFKQNIDAADACLPFALPAYLFGETPLVERPEALQPTLVAYMVALYRAAGLRPDVMFGLSLGEYAALIASDMLSLEAGLALVQTRGQAMAAACQTNPGGMLALRLKDPQQAQAIATWPDVWLANRNAPTQLVLGGTTEGLAAAQKQARKLGIKALPLRVAGAFHTPLMAPAQPPLQQALTSAPWQAGTVPVISTTAQVSFTPDNAPAVLAAQVATQTDLASTIAQAVAGGVERIVEIGPRPVLAKAIRNQAPTLTVTTLSDATALKGA
ncbi:ACP S-malonyltransferase [Lacticaseibacillus sp. GG6-2]